MQAQYLQLTFNRWTYIFQLVVHINYVLCSKSKPSRLTCLRLNLRVLFEKTTAIYNFSMRASPDFLL